MDEDYQKNKDLINQWIESVFSESDALFERTRKKSIAYFKLVAADPSHKYREFCDEALDAYYDTVYDDALDTYFAKDFAGAIKKFEKVYTVMPDDPPTAVFLERAHKLMTTGVPDEWDGVVNMTSK